MPADTTPTEPESNIKVFPNPFANEFTVDTGTEKFKQIELIDEAGKQVYTQIVPNGETLIKISPKVKSGAYLLKMSNDKSLVVKKIFLLHCKPRLCVKICFQIKYALYYL